MRAGSGPDLMVNCWLVRDFFLSFLFSLFSCVPRLPVTIQCPDLGLIDVFVKVISLDSVLCVLCADQGP